MVRGKKRAIYLVTEDNEMHFARGVLVQIKCCKCLQYSKLKHFNLYREKKDYICFHCLFSGKNNPFFGKKHSSEFKERLSKERKGKWYIGKNNPMYGKNIKDYMSPEKYDKMREKLSKASKGKNNPMYGKNIKDYMSPEKYEQWKKNVSLAQQNMSDEQKKLRSKRVSDGQKRCQERNPEYYRQIKSKAGRITASKQINYKKTKPEQLLEDFLIRNNVNYDYSCIIGSGDTCFQYDFIIHKKRILIEVQGNYWHGDPEIYNEDGSDGKIKLNDIQKKKINRDKIKKEFAEKKNFKLICIWESEIKNNDFSKLKEIL